MPERYFFEIPIYSCSSDAFYRKLDERIQKYLDDLAVRSGGITRERAPNVYTLAEDRLRSQAGAWTFNQVIGWIPGLTHYKYIDGEI